MGWQDRPAIGRRAALLGAAAVAAAGPAAAQQTPGVSQDLVAAANREGKVVFYTSIEIGVAQNIAKGFMKRYPKIQVQVERNGAERILQRLMQEYGSNIHTADTVESSDVTSFIDWKQHGMLAQFLPPDVVKEWPKQERDPDGHFATVRATVSVIAYNNELVKAADAPASYADLLEPKWDHKLVKASPNYSGVIVVATYALSKALGWEWFEKLAKQHVMQVQSATEPPKKIAQGERPVQVDGGEYVDFVYAEKGNPITVVYAKEGSPLISGQAAVMKDAPHPNAARLFDIYLFSQEAQQLMVDQGELRSFHPGIHEKPGRTPLSQIKLLRSDPVDLARSVKDLKAKYSQIFGA
jgi:iron(III) transport system substrate-binding protein